MENTFSLSLRCVTLALFILTYCNVSVVTGLFGEVVEDITTDRLFEDMGQADIVEFNIEDGIITFNVTVEDRRGQDEFWLIDFQPFVYMGKSAINLSTAYLSSNATGTCSNVERSHSITDGYFGDNFFQSRNSTGTKELFAVYERGFYDENGTRVDSMSYEGNMANIMNCRHTDGSRAWQYYIGTHEVVFTTVLYATNIRPLETSIPQLTESIAYVQTNFKLVWTISRIAILNFVIASQSAYEPKMIEWVGRVIVEFDFAIVEPYLLEDGAVDTSRVHLEMGISTYTPTSNSSLLVFMGEDFMGYTAETPGNVMTEILEMPTTLIEDSPSCSFRREGYCRQQWEFEFILEMNTTHLSEERPLDATGIFLFQFDSYYCEDLEPSLDCVNHGLPLWNVSADVTLQTVIDIVDEDLDTVSVSVVKMSNDKGEDLRGGSSVSHMENVTVEVAISPSFLQERFHLELSLFMVCMGEDQSESSRGCLGSDESERYTAFLAEDFEMEYDPLLDPVYLIESTTAVHSLTSAVAVVAEPARYVEVDTNRQFLLVQERSTGSTYLLPADQATSPNDGRVLETIFIQTIVPPLETPKNKFVIVKTGSSLSLILSKEAYSEFGHNYADPQTHHVFQNVFDAMPPQSGIDYKMKLFSSYLKFPGQEISYFGFIDPSFVPCDDFPELDSYQEFTDLHLSPFVPAISAVDVLYLRDIGAFYALMINLTGSEGEDETDNFEGGNFQSVEQWENVRDRFDGIFNGESYLQSLVVDTVRIAHDDGPERLQELLYSLVLFQPGISSTLVSDNIVFITNDLARWTGNAETDLLDFLASVVASSIFDPDIQGRTTLLDHLKKAAQELKHLFPEEKQSSEIDAEFNHIYWIEHEFDESFYDFLINLTLQKNGHWNGADYLSTSYVSESIYDSENKDNVISDRVLGYEILGCSVVWDLMSSMWVYREPHVQFVETLAGGWDHWSMWSSCSTSCEGGVQVRQRQCLDRQMPCTGTSDEVRTCNELRCGLFRDEDNLVHDVALSDQPRNFIQTQQYCESVQAIPVSYPETPSQDEYILNRMGYQHIDHIWINPVFLGTCSVLRYNGEVIDADCSSHYLSFCIKDFVKVFEGYAGNGQSIVDAWFGISSGTDVNGGGIHPQHFADLELMAMWNTGIDVKMIELALYKNDQIVLDFRFDGAGTTRRNWFKEDSLETAWPYQDITGGESQPILQKHGRNSKYKKVLTADKKLGNCDERRGWLMLLDDEENIMCDWQKNRRYPLFLYSKRNTASKWSSQFIGSATRVVLSLKYHMQEPSPPPVTFPPSVVYTSQNVEAPEEWQKLNYEEYDDGNEVHRSEFTNFALSADTAVYTMTAVYGVVEKPSGKRRRQAERSQRSLMKSLEFPQMKSIPFAFKGCPKDSLHNPSFLSCDCEAPGYVYSRDTFICEPGHQLEVIPSSDPVPTACGTKDKLLSMYAVALCIMGTTITEYIYE